MTTTNLDDWLNQPAPAVESAACFFGDCTHCPDPASCPHGCHREMKRDLLQAIENDGRYASVSTVRAAIFDVIDGGCTCGASEKHPWELDEVHVGSKETSETIEEIVDMQRERFVDSVCTRITQLQSPPFELDGELWERMKSDD
jgi:hypothetical protein